MTSDYARLKATDPALTAVNDAKTGAKMADLAGQLSTASGQKADYVTVLMGANDLCTSTAAAMTDPQLFRTQFQTALDGYFATAPAAAHAFVSSIPNLYQLWSLLHTRASGTWKTFGICQSMLSSANTEAQRQAVVTREAALNAALADVCTSQPNNRCHWDGYATYNVAFTTSDVSTVDYFHPSVSGQKKLAGVAWAAGAS